MSKSHQFIFVIFAIIIVGSTIWYLDLSHKPVETVDVLIGKNYDYALKSYFKCELLGKFSITPATVIIWLLFPFIYMAFPTGF